MPDKALVTTGLVATLPAIIYPVMTKMHALKMTSAQKGYVSVNSKYAITRYLIPAQMNSSFALSLKIPEYAITPPDCAIINMMTIPVKWLVVSSILLS
jgi:hypothetical protein